MTKAPSKAEFQKCEIIKYCCSKSPSLWQFVTAATGNLYRDEVIYSWSQSVSGGGAGAQTREQLTSNPMLSTAPSTTYTHRTNKRIKY